MSDALAPSTGQQSQGLARPGLEGTHRVKEQRGPVCAAHAHQRVACAHTAVAPTRLSSSVPSSRSPAGKARGMLRVQVDWLQGTAARSNQRCVHRGKPLWCFSCTTQTTPSWSTPATLSLGRESIEQVPPIRYLDGCCCRCSPPLCGPLSARRGRRPPRAWRAFQWTSCQHPCWRRSARTMSWPAMSATYSPPTKGGLTSFIYTFLGSQNTGIAMGTQNNNRKQFPNGKLHTLIPTTVASTRLILPKVDLLEF